MKIKTSDKRDFLHYMNNALKITSRILFNKKSFIIFAIFFIIIILLMGIFFGLLISKFFGTLDNPSRTLIDIIDYFNIHNEAKNLVTQADWIRKENIKIPFNYINGQFSNPEKIFIDVGFEDFKLIEYQREQALERGLIVEKDYVPANIRYNDKETKVRLRLKGDALDHLESDKWSFRIKVKGDDTLFGMKTFSIQAPHTRKYLNEWIFQNALKKDDIMNLRYDFIEVVINGENKGIYAIEEHFEKQLIENNNRREGVIIKFDDEGINEEFLRGYSYFDNEADSGNYINYYLYPELSYTSPIGTFDNNKITLDPYLSEQFIKARDLLELFRNGELKTHEVFDVDKFAKYFAIVTVLGCSHGSQWSNIRFYYNPITSKLEPIGYDGDCGAGAIHVINPILECTFDSCSKEDVISWNLIFMDEVFFRRYVQELEKVSKKEYLDELFLELDEDIKRNVNIIHKDTPTYHFSKDIFYKNRDVILDKLNPIQSINAYFQDYSTSERKIVLSIGNAGSFPIEIVNAVYNDSVVFEPTEKYETFNSKDIFKPVEYKKIEFKIPNNFDWSNDTILNLKLNYKIYGTDNILNEDVLPFSYLEEEFLEKDFIRKKPNADSFEFLDIDYDNRIISFQEGNWIVDRDLIIPEGFSVFAKGGTTIDLIKGSMILSYSDLQFLGDKENKINIISSDKSGQGIAVFNVEKISNFENVILSDLKNPSKEGWGLTGAITFYLSPVIIDNVLIRNMNAEDSLNIINSEFEIKNSDFENCGYDCLDDDFGNGRMNNVSFINCGNDCTDFSGCSVEIKNVDIKNFGDKGISIGERSNLVIEDAEIIGKRGDSYIGIASKDLSDASAKNVKISEVEYGFAVYQKKPEYGPASMNVNEVILSEVGNNYIVEEKSSLLIDGININNKKKQVYIELYGQ